jgi:hypothetical protein
MSFSTPSKLYHSKSYSADLECEHCHGIVRHQPWCITRNAVVQNAYECVLDESKLSIQDRMILHALGVAWKTTKCAGPCASSGNLDR